MVEVEVLEVQFLVLVEVVKDYLVTLKIYSKVAELEK
jgi:hypothetical protein